MSNLKFEYQPSYSFYLFLSIFCGFLTVFMTHKALISNSGQTMFLSIVVFINLMGTLMGVGTIYINLTSDREITLGEKSISAPKHLMSRNIVTINYFDIERLQVKQNGKTITLIIYHKEGKLEIMRNALPSKEAFDELLNELKKRI